MLRFKLGHVVDGAWCDTAFLAGVDSVGHLVGWTPAGSTSSVHLASVMAGYTFCDRTAQDTKIHIPDLPTSVEPHSALSTWWRGGATTNTYEGLGPAHYRKQRNSRSCYTARREGTPWRGLSHRQQRRVRRDNYYRYLSYRHGGGAGAHSAFFSDTEGASVSGDVSADSDVSDARALNSLFDTEEPVCRPSRQMEPRPRFDDEATEENHALFDRWFSSPESRQTNGHASGAETSSACDNWNAIPPTAQPCRTHSSDTPLLGHASTGEYAGWSGVWQPLDIYEEQQSFLISIKHSLALAQELISEQNKTISLLIEAIRIGFGRDVTSNGRPQDNDDIAAAAFRGLRSDIEACCLKHRAAHDRLPAYEVVDMYQTGFKTFSNSSADIFFVESHEHSDWRSNISAAVSGLDTLDFSLIHVHNVAADDAAAHYVDNNEYPIGAIDHPADVPTLVVDDPFGSQLEEHHQDILRRAFYGMFTFRVHRILARLDTLLSSACDEFVTKLLGDDSAFIPCYYVHNQDFTNAGLRLARSLGASKAVIRELDDWTQKITQAMLDAKNA